MKTHFFRGFAGVILLALGLWSCQKDVADTHIVKGSNWTVGDRAVCCVPIWNTVETRTLTTNLYLGVWNDETAVHYTVYRTEGATFGNIRFSATPNLGCDAAVASLGSNLCTEENGCTSVSFTVPISNNCWQSCQSVRIVLRVTGLGGAGGTWQDCVDYTLRAQTPDANAGPDQPLCNTADFTLAAVPSITPSTLPCTAKNAGWSFVGDNLGATLTDPSSPTSTVTGVPAGGSVTLRWTEDNRGCTDSDDVVLTNEVCGCADAFSWEALGNDQYEFCFTSGEDIENAHLTFTFPQADMHFVALEGWYIPGNDNSQTLQTVMDIEACTEYCWTVTLKPVCNENQKAVNLWTDFKVGEFSKKGSASNIRVDCPK